MFRLNRNKQKANRNSLKGSIFCYFLQKFFRVFPFFSFYSVCFDTVCFGCFASILKQRVTMFPLNRNKQKTHPNSLKVIIFGYFFRKFRVVSVCFGLLRNSSVCFGCFDIGSKHRNKRKFFSFWFHETNRNKPETDLVSVCFGSDRNLFLYVSRTPSDALSLLNDVCNSI